jgi:hypothetical protein
MFCFKRRFSGIRVQLLNVRTSGGELKIAISVEKMMPFLNPLFIPFFLILQKIDSVKNYTKSDSNHGSDSSSTKPTSCLSTSAYLR